MVSIRMLKRLLTFVFAIYSPLLFAQQYHTLSGFVTDTKNGERLVGATVYVPELKKGTTTNKFGFYSLSVDIDTIELVYSYVGYARRKEIVTLGQDVRLDIELSSNNLLQEVEVKALSMANPINSQMSSYKFSMETIRMAPMLAGETDIMRTLQLLPGVKFGNEGSTGLYIRGGSPDQNLILLDGVPVYNVSHLFGFLSVFNTDAINDVELIKGGIPARYGGRLSSVLNINMKEGNLKERQGVFTISPLATQFTYESPIKKDKSSFILSARRTWLDILLRLASLSDERTLGYGFYDINAKYNNKLNNNNRIYLSFYAGRDRFFDTVDDGDNNYTFNFKWGNLTSVFRWNKVFSPQLFSNFSLSYSTFNFFQEYEVEQNTNTSFFRNSSQIRDAKLQFDLDYTIASSHQLRFGGKISLLRFRPEVIQTVNASLNVTSDAKQSVNAINPEVYVEDEIKVNSDLTLNIGLRGATYILRDQSYINIQPRLAIQHLLSPTFSIRGSYTRMNQYIHLLTNSSLGLPTDLWVTSTEEIEPQQSDQITIGLSKTLPNNTWELTVESYYKRMRHLIAYRDGANYLFDDGQDWEEKVVGGDGDSYGIELFLNKKRGKLTGWLGYTLSFTNRWFDAIDNGRKFPFKYDRRHDLSLLLNYHLPKQRTLSATFVLATGNAVTLPTARYQGTSPPLWQYNVNTSNAFTNRVLLGQRNNTRTPAYHRLDLSYQRMKEKGKGNCTWTFSLYNIYNRLNPYFLYSASGKIMKYSLFPIIPSVGYRWEF